ncbi:unnamed protein product [Lymnaea stagnalis]|uniref:FYVE-type domain-containing protein n=1 Tax=Lymnaea stagnalis TaxID=6523 RepID=A0AAV2HRE1_LYMST
MDFVDLDKVLDEFEEEEKQALSIVPGQELKPSGYSEFLEKQAENEWNALNPNKFPSYSGYTLERRSVREPSNVSYDDPYDSFSNSKLGFITDHQINSLSFNGYDRSSDGKKRNNQNEIVTNLTRVSANGENVNTVYTSTNAYDRKGIANSSERKGTIAYQPIEVQTDALSPASEHELMSSPFPKSDILVDGHGNTAVNCQTKTYNEPDQNHSPIYASMDTVNLVPNTSVLAEQQPQTSTSQNQNLSEDSVQILSVNNTSVSNSQVWQASVTTTPDVDKKLDVSEQTVGFYDPVDEDLDDSEVNMYLNELDEGVVGNYNASKTPGEYNTSVATVDQCHVPDIQSDLSSDQGRRSLADELSEAESKLDHYSPSHPMSQTETIVTASGVDSPAVSLHHPDPDLVADLGIHSQEIATNHFDETQRSESKTHDSIRQNVYSSIMRGKMEIENILDTHERAHSVDSGGIGEHLLQGKMEIEGILDKVVEAQGMKYNGTTKLEPSQLMTSLNQPDVTQGSDSTSGLSSTEERSFEVSSAFHDLRSISPAPSLSSNSSETGNSVLSGGLGARPKDPLALKKNRPNSLLGLSKVNLNLPSVVKTVGDSNIDDDMQHPKSAYFPDVTIQSQPPSSDLEDMGQREMTNGSPIIHDFTTSHSGADSDLSSSPQENYQGGTGQKTKRPTSLNIRRPEFSIEHSYDGDEREDEPSPSSAEPQDQSNLANGDEINSINRSPELAEDGTVIMSTTQPLTLMSNLGYQAPFWIPDAEANECMMCKLKFTMWKRRHHCRACGKVLCSSCCSQKAILPYMENKEARVCLDCHNQLSLAPGAGANPRPNPNNPNEYCSKVPPNQQASSHASPPVVMVPTGVLKPSGSQKRTGEPKQVMFSDGIRPGGDLTELDGPEQTRPRRSARAVRRGAHQGSPPARKIKDDSLSRSPCLLPEEGLPPLYIIQGDSGFIERDEALNQIDYTADYKSEGGPLIFYAANKNLAVGVKILNLDCCVNRVCWCFVTRGMNTAGQSELIVLLELTEEEMTSPSLSPPRDMFIHLHNVYEEALKGIVCYPIQDMGHSMFHQNFLGHREHGGFLYLRPTFQCLNKLPLPESPFLFGILLQKWEVPWAKVFPIRLMLRLGAEYRYYPCPLVGVRNRKPVFFEIGHTIINLLADFRNYQYMLTQIRGVTIHMENKKTVISFPRNRYNDVMKVVRNSNEHVMAFGSSFSSEADSHLVCIQNDDGNYQTQAINIQNKPRLVTGASFVVFNGALKASSGLRAKSSIVEDGLMVQVLPEAMVSIKEALKDMTDYTIQCGPTDSSTVEEMVELKWVDNDRNFNIGVKSYIDETSLEGVESVSVKSPSDFFGETLAIRWTRVYFLQHQDSTSSHFDPLDLSRLTEDIAQACCTALVKHLDDLKKEGQVKLGLRVNLTRDSVGYEIGSRGQQLPAPMINNLDTFLVPIVHQASEEGIVMELVFNIVD